MKQIIIDAINRVFEVDGNLVFSRNRGDQTYSDIRLMIYYFLRERGWSYNQIGVLFQRKHCTVYRGVNTYKDILSVYETERERYENFIKNINISDLTDKELLTSFLRTYENVLSDDLKNYLSVRL